MDSFKRIKHLLHLERGELLIQKKHNILSGMLFQTRMIYTKLKAAANLKFLTKANFLSLNPM